MPHFITRIELHQAKFPDDYNRLHAAMLLNSQFIKSDSGQIYELPAAEYYININSSIDEVYNSALLAANTPGKSFWAITTEMARSKWQLQEVKETAYSLR